MKRKRLIMLMEIAIFSAIGFILEVFSFNFMPQGGGIGIKIIPILMMSYRWGLFGGLLSGLMISLLSLTTGFILVHWAQLFLDYFLANLVIGFVALFREPIVTTIQSSKKILLAFYIFLSVIIVNALRLFVYVLSGVIFFSQYAEGKNVWIYSIGYNASFMVPETILVAFITMLLILAKPDFLVSKYNK